MHSVRSCSVLVDDVVMNCPHRRDTIHDFRTAGKMLADSNARHGGINAWVIAAGFFRLGVAHCFRVPGVDLRSTAAEPDVNDVFDFSFGKGM